MDKYDLGAVCFDWDSEAVERLRSLCKDLGAGIVISSDWRRSKSTRGLQALFRVYELHHYVTDATNESGGPPLGSGGQTRARVSGTNRSSGATVCGITPWSTLKRMKVSRVLRELSKP